MKDFKNELVELIRLMNNSEGAENFVNLNWAIEKAEERAERELGLTRKEIDGIEDEIWEVAA